MLSTVSDHAQAERADVSAGRVAHGGVEGARRHAGDLQQLGFVERAWIGQAALLQSGS